MNLWTTTLWPRSFYWSKDWRPWQWPPRTADRSSYLPRLGVSDRALPAAFFAAALLIAAKNLGF